MGVGFVPQGGLGGWAPGSRRATCRRAPAISCRRAPTSSCRSTTTATAGSRRTARQIGLYFAKKPVEQPFQGGVIAGGGRRFAVLLDPGRRRATSSSPATSGSTQDCTLHSVMPHMHLLGKEIKVTMTPPDGPAETLLAIKDWDYNWQETYFFKEPIAGQGGHAFDVEADLRQQRQEPEQPVQPAAAA